MRILFDTNVLIASLIANGFCQELVENGFVEHELITSEFILSELKSKLTGKFRFAEETALEAVELFRNQMEVIDHAPLDFQVCRDVDDDNVLAAAVAGLCNFIITGDKDLLEIQQYKNIQILSPRVFTNLESLEN